MSEEVFDQIVYSKNVIEFVTVANEYCSFVENNTSFSQRQFVEKAQKIFALLYLKASMLPDIDDENAETPDKYVTEVDYNFLLESISSKLGEHDGYLEVFDPNMQFSDAPLESSIAENICDIYQDLKDFIFAFRIGTVEIMTDALWECQNNFKEFWGQKLVNGLRAIHALIYGENNLNEKPSVGLANGKANNNPWISKHFDNYSNGDEQFDNDL